MTSTPSGKTMGWLLCGAMAWALATATLAAGSSAGPAARNLDFEQGQPGALPPGWSAAGAQVGGFTATMSRAQPHGGPRDQRPRVGCAAGPPRAAAASD